MATLPLSNIEDLRQLAGYYGKPQPPDDPYLSLKVLAAGIVIVVLFLLYLFNQ